MSAPNKQPNYVGYAIGAALFGVGATIAGIGSYYKQKEELAKQQKIADGLKKDLAKTEQLATNASKDLQWLEKNYSDIYNQRPTAQQKPVDDEN